jgi:hypothetical protein
LGLGVTGPEVEDGDGAVDRVGVTGDVEFEEVDAFGLVAEELGEAEDALVGGSVGLDARGGADGDGDGGGDGGDGTFGGLLNGGGAELGAGFEGEWDELFAEGTEPDVEGFGADEEAVGDVVELGEEAFDLVGSPAGLHDLDIAGEAGEVGGDGAGLALEGDEAVNAPVDQDEGASEDEEDGGAESDGATACAGAGEG